jgi:hypothetical protein
VQLFSFFATKRARLDFANLRAALRVTYQDRVVDVPLVLRATTNQVGNVFTSVSVLPTIGHCVRIAGVKQMLKQLAADEDAALLLGKSSDLHKHTQVAVSVAQGVLSRHTALFAEAEKLTKDATLGLREMFLACDIMLPESEAAVQTQKFPIRKSQFHTVGLLEARFLVLT